MLKFGDRDRMVVGLTTTNVHMQSVPVTTDVASSNLDQGEMYNIMFRLLAATEPRVFNGQVEVITMILLTVTAYLCHK
jgi:hypothetical protein